MATTETSAETRQRILDAAWKRVHERGTHAVSVKEIAAAAGVSRQLVYFHFQNRAGLLLAMARHRDRRSGFIARVSETRELPPVEGLDALLHAWCAYVPELLPVARALEAAMITGDEGGEAFRDRMSQLHEVLELALQRVADAGRLAPGWTVRAAADWACSRVHPASFAHLVGECGWSPRRFSDRTVRSLLDELVA